LQKICDCLRLATNAIFIIYLHPFSTVADMMNNMLISVSAAKWYILHVRNYSVRTWIQENSASKYPDLLPGRKCLSGCSTKYSYFIVFLFYSLQNDIFNIQRQSHTHKRWQLTQNLFFERQQRRNEEERTSLVAE